MADYSNETWIEQATGLDIVIGPVQEETRSVVISVRPTVHEDRVFRVYHVAGVAGSTSFADEAVWDESAISGFIADGVLTPP
jgi:hypothetical protein